VLRYIQGRIRAGLTYRPAANGARLIEGISDSDYAQDKDTRRSVTGASITEIGAPVLAVYPTAYRHTEHFRGRIYFGV
jgi:hypothetical protein